MLLSIRFPGGERDQLIGLLGGEEECHLEFTFGEGLAWVEAESGPPAIHFSLFVQTAPVVARTKRRDKAGRFSVGYCDSFPFVAHGLMALFLARLRMPAPSFQVRELQVDLVYYPERPHAEEIARRLFAPAGYAVEVQDGRLRLAGRGRVGELPALLLALDRKTRLFLTAEELEEVREYGGRLASSHPARRAIELALSGRPTPLRFFVPESRLVREEEATEEVTAILETPLSTQLVSRIPVAEAQREFALRMFSRVNIDRKWLIYLPSAISSIQSRDKASELERPEEAISYFRDQKIDKVVVEEKHMGSRGIVVLCRTHECSRNRFGVDSEIAGCAYTRNGRRFFKDEDTEAVFLERLREAISRARFWERFSTNWVCADGEILPWSVKQADSPEESGLVEAGIRVLQETEIALSRTCKSSLEAHWKTRLEHVRAVLGAYNLVFTKYRSQTYELRALKFAPFHLLATEGQTFFHRSHLWHIEALSRIARSSAHFVIPTRHELVRTREPNTWSKTLQWWEELSKDSAEGIVVKPLPFVPRGRRGLAQPALKCRSREHLRLVYGPDYDSDESKEILLSRDALLHRRNKHRRILRQFALSMEAVNRFVKRNPLDAVHECVLGVLAQEVAPMEHD